MVANVSPVARETLERVLTEIYPKAKLHIEWAAGGFFVGVVDPGLAGKESDPAAIPNLREKVRQANAVIAKPEDRVVVFGLGLFRDERGLYTDKAILRTRRNSWDGGHRTFHTSAGDGFVLAHKLDAEALLIDPTAKDTCRVIPDPELPRNFRIGQQKYLQFDLGGQSMDVKSVEELNDGALIVGLS